MATLSKTRVDKAGDRLRKHELRDIVLDAAARDVEMEVIRAWRQEHQQPMGATRSLLRTTFADVLARRPNGSVFSRLKREEQILAKLCRQRTRLSTVEDIGGCRAIVDSLREAHLLVDALAERGRREGVSMEVVSIDDYIATPQISGYRGVHLHCARSGRQIEVQIRTLAQHAWADLVEQVDAAFGFDAKHDSAPEQALEGLRLFSEALHVRDTEGDTVYAQVSLEHAMQTLVSSFSQGAEE